MTAQQIIDIAAAEIGYTESSAGSKEIWKPIPGYEGKYEASSFGRVRSLDRYVSGKTADINYLISGKILTPIKNKNGYLRVNLCNEEGHKAKYIHRLIASAFFPLYHEGNDINHKDENPENNSLSNIEWCTKKYNANYGTRNKRISLQKIGKKRAMTDAGKAKMIKTKVKPVIGVNIKSGEQVSFCSMSSARKDGFSPVGISHCITGRQKTHKGFLWRVDNEYS